MKARAEELKYFDEMGVYEHATMEECKRITGKAPIGTRWIDISKGDSITTTYRSPIAAKDFTVDVRPGLLAATPQTECLRLFLSRVAAHNDNKVLYTDVS